jgi:2-polyprenyl-3-methyl-5-hydroxy-6-metoxy-1,4-benzoquinol methylase
MERNLDELRQLDVLPRISKLAVDLGAGQGLYAIPLARLGFSVRSCQ